MIFREKITTNFFLNFLTLLLLFNRQQKEKLNQNNLI